MTLWWDIFTGEEFFKFGTLIYTIIILQTFSFKVIEYSLIKLYLSSDSYCTDLNCIMPFIELYNLCLFSQGSQRKYISCLSWQIAKIAIIRISDKCLFRDRICSLHPRPSISQPSPDLTAEFVFSKRHTRVGRVKLGIVFLFMFLA